MWRVVMTKRRELRGVVVPSPTTGVNGYETWGMTACIHPEDTDCHVQHCANFFTTWLCMPSSLALRGRSYAPIACAYSSICFSCSVHSPPTAIFYVNLTQVSDDQIQMGTIEFDTGFANVLVVYRAICFRPFVNEVLDAAVSHVTELGFFAEVGPLEVFVSRLVRAAAGGAGVDVVAIVVVVSVDAVFAAKTLVPFPIAFWFWPLRLSPFPSSVLL